MEKFFLGSGVIVAALFALAHSPQQKTETLLNPVTAINRSGISLLTDTVPDKVMKELTDKPLSNIQTTVDGKKYLIIIKDDKVSELFIDDKAVPKEKITDYEPITSKILLEARENRNRELLLAEKAKQMAELSKVSGDESKIVEERAKEAEILEKLLKEEMLKKGKDVDKIKGNLDEIKMQIEKEMLMKERAEQYESLQDRYVAESRESRELSEQVRQNKELEERYVREAQRYNEGRSEMRTRNGSEIREQAERAREQATQLRIQAEVAERLARELERQAEKEGRKARAEQDDAKKIQEEMMSDLVKEKVIKDKSHVSISLNENELIVNGVKQPDAIFQKFKEKYIKGRNWNFNYNNNNSRKVQ